MTETLLPIFGIIVASFLPVLIWSSVIVLGDKKKEPFLVLSLAFLWGGLSTIPILLLRFATEQIQWFIDWRGALSMVATIIVVAVIEEMSKHLSAVQVMHNYLRARDEVSDGIVYGMIVGLGFAFVENAVYLYELFLSGQSINVFMVTYLIRSFHTMVAHAIFSGIFGYFYGLGFICPNMKTITSCAYKVTPISLLKHIGWGTFTFRGMRSLVSRDTERSLDGIALVAEGFLLAILLHMIYNLILSFPGLGSWYLVVLTLYLFPPAVFLLNNIREERSST